MNKLMKNCYSVIVLLSMLLLPLSNVIAQSITYDKPQPATITGNTSGGVCFNFTTNAPITLEHVRCNLSTTSGTATIWYNPTKINGQPVINAANGWINLGSTPITGLASVGNRSPLVTIPVLMNLDLYAGDTIGIAIQWNGNNYPTDNVNVTSFTNGTVTMIADASSAFTYNSGMTSFYTPRQINGGVVYKLKPQGNNDIGISSLVSPLNFCSGTQNIQVRLTNFGINNVTSGTVNWSLDGVAQTPLNLSMNLDTLNGAMPYDTVITLGSYNFTSNSVALKAWTILPNGQADTFNLNDTLSTILQSSLSGTYTVNSAVATGGTNFQTLTDLSNTLTAVGVCGPVVVNVVANSGPYTGKFTLSGINGLSTTNTLRINGNNNIVNVATAATNGQREMLLLDNVSDVTLNGFDFRTTGTAAWGALITGGATRDSLLNNKFNLSNITSSSSASNAGIVFSGSNSSATGTGNSGTHVVVKGNHLLGSALAGGLYYGVGLSAASDSNIVDSNIIENFYNAGVYLAANAGNKVSRNVISRPNKTSGFTTAYGVYLVSGSSSGHVIDANKIHSNAQASATISSTFYGIYSGADATAANPNIISNNLIYNINGGSLYGVYLTTSAYAKVLHNTIDLDVNTNRTSSNYGLYASGTNNGSVFYNNNVSITGGGTGSKYGFYYSTANSITDVQKNNFYVNSRNAGNQYYGYWSGAYATHAVFSAVRPTLEVGSPSANPLYMNATLANYTPTNTALIANGINVAADVPQDINGRIRTPIPTIGAFEKDLTTPNNLALLSVVEPTSSYCIDSVLVKVSLVNFGSTPINSFKLTGTYNNNPLDTFTYNQLLPTIQANPTAAFDTVSFATVMANATSGDLKLWVVDVNDMADADQSDDSLQVNIQGTTFELVASEDTLCGAGNVRLTVSPRIEDGTAIWETSVDGITWTVVTGITGSEYNTTINTATQFRVKVNKSLNGCYTNTKALSYFTPELLFVKDSAACVEQPMSLIAQGNAGSNIYWYETPTDVDPIHVGDTFSLQGLTNTTTYYVEAVSAKATGIVGPRNVGIGSSGVSSNSYKTFFTANKNILLKSVTVFSNSANASSNIVITNVNTNQIVGTYPFTIINTGSNVNGGNIVEMNIGLPPGEYSMGLSNNISLYRNSTGAAYPYVTDAITITEHSNNFASNSDDFYSFYNWEYETGCASVRTPVTAEVLPTPSVDLGTDINQCYDEGEFEFLNARNPGSFYEWDDNSTNQVRLVDQSGTYWVRVYNDRGCSDSDTINVTYKNNPISLLPTDTTVCNNTVVSLDAGDNGIQYYWSNGATTSTTKVNRGGTYTIQITGNNGCVTSDTVVVNMQGEAPTYDNIQARSSGGNTFRFRLINPRNITQVRWDFGDGNFSDSNEPTHSYAADGNYVVTVATQSSCGAKTDTTTVHLKGFTSIESLDAHNEIKLYPNPTLRLTTIECLNADDKIETIEVYDITGKQLMSFSKFNQSKAQIDVSMLAAGMYQLNVITNNGAYKMKLDKLN